MKYFKKKLGIFLRKATKLRFILAVAFLSVGTLVGIVFYFNMDPELMTKLSFYANLANPSVEIVRVQAGLRKEEVAEILTHKLNWTGADQSEFINAHLAMNMADQEGRYFPKTYLIHKDTEPSEVSAIMTDEFTKQLGKLKNTPSKSILNEDFILRIASIIQREASGKEDMRLISGIIWNRIFDDMKLQMDATLQYAKGSKEEGWWKKVSSEDKKIKSPYNTYMYKGLPPGAISSPGLSAISAAYNPQKTSCIFYLHDKNRKIHCTKTYEEHQRNIEKYLK